MPNFIFSYILLVFSFLLSFSVLCVFSDCLEWASMKLLCRLFSLARRLVLFFYHTAFYLEAHTGWGGGGGTPYNSLHGEAPAERGTIFRLQVYERIEILLVEVYGRVGKSVFWVCERTQRAEQMNFIAV